MKKVKQSFTLVEILVVIVIIGILSSFIFFTVNDSVEKANIAKSKMFAEALRNNLLMNLVSEWKMDDEDDLGFDSWGNNNGSDSNVGYEADCISGGCGSFNGTSSYIDCESLNSIIGASEFTGSVWVKTNSISLEYQEIFVKGSNDVLMRIDYNNLLCAINDTSFTVLNSVEKDIWINFVFVWNKAVNNVKVYKNGLIIYDNPLTTSKIIDSGNFYIGRWSDSLTELFTGLIDEVQIYDAAMSESQIKQNYLAGLNNLYAKGMISEIEYNDKLMSLK